MHCGGRPSTTGVALTLLAHGWYSIHIVPVQADFLHRYVKTNILTQKDWEAVSAVGVQFAEAEDAGRCLLRILSDPTVNGHSFFLSARKWAASGFIDLDLDDYKNTLLQEIQEDQMKGAPVSLGLFG